MENLLKLNPLMRISFDSPIYCELPFEKTFVNLDEESFTVVVYLLNKNNEERIQKEDLLDDLSGMYQWNTNKSSAIVEKLIEESIIVDELYKECKSEALQHWYKRGWSDGLFFHLLTRDLPYTDDNWHSKVSGKAEETLGKPLPALWRNRSKSEAISLKKEITFPEDISIYNILASRRSASQWDKGSISIEDISSILYAANEESRTLRLSLEEVALNPKRSDLVRSSFTPFETFCIIQRSPDITSGLYEYNIREHELSVSRPGDFEELLKKMLIGQKSAGGMSCAFIITAIWERYFERYSHPRAYTNLMVQVAELAQKYILAATALGYSTWLSPALDDDLVSSFIDKSYFKETALYCVVIG